MKQSLREKIIERMSFLDIQPKRSLGQNFLVSDNVVDKILTAADAGHFDQVIEIGPGLGALTDGLIESSKKFEVVELDKKFAEFWKEQGLQVTEVDALKFYWEDYLSNNFSSLLVSNLPYQISSRLVVDLSLIKPSFNRMVLMFQKEVAQRIQADPDSEDYGLLSVIAQCFWITRIVSEAGAVDFMPKPNVASRVLCFEAKSGFPDVVNANEFMKFVKLSFANRRKKLLPKLMSYQDKAQLKEIFSNLGHSEDIRCEKLSPHEFIDLYLALKKEY